MNPILNKNQGKFDSLNGVIYMWTSSTTGKSYIGQTIQKIRRRKSTGYNCHFQNAINKYGWNDFSLRILEECPTDDLNTKERYWIKYYDTCRNGYNSTFGGEGARGYKQSRETIKSKSCPVVQYDLQGNMVNEFSSMNEAMRKTGVRHIHECIARNKYHTAGGYVWVKKNEKFKLLKDNYRGRKVAIQKFDKNENFIKEYVSIAEAGRTSKIHEGHISECAKGKRKTAGGYIWKYAVQGG